MWIEMAFYAVILLALGLYLAKTLWWDHRASAARLERSKHLADLIADSTAGKAAKIEAGIELYGLSGDLADRLRQESEGAGDE